jgi:hypothetical protein
LQLLILFRGSVDAAGFQNPNREPSALWYGEWQIAETDHSPDKLRIDL